MKYLLAKVPYMYECQPPHLGLLRLRTKVEFLRQPLANDVSMSLHGLTLESERDAVHDLS